MAWTQGFKELPKTSGENPGLVASRIRDLKDEIQNIVDNEHYLNPDTGDDEYEYNYQHKAGSAKIFVKTIATEDATTRPDGTTLDEYDDGRLLTTTDDDALKIYKTWTETVDEVETDYAKFVHMFESADINGRDTLPTDTLSSIQDKLDALAYQIAAIKGGTVEDESDDDYGEVIPWSTAPETSLNTLLNTLLNKTGITSSRVLTGTKTSTELTTWLDTFYTLDDATLGITIPLSGSVIYDDDTILVVSHAIRSIGASYNWTLCGGEITHAPLSVSGSYKEKLVTSESSYELSLYSNGYLA